MKRSLLFALVGGVLAVNLLIGARVYSTSTEGTPKNPYPNLKLFSTVMETVRKDYVDGQNLTYQDLVYGALKGMIDKLDPHSEFLDPEKYRELQNDTEGHFGGLGIMIGSKDGFITVIAPMDGTPGFKAGILSGDRIIKIDGKSTENLSIQDAVKVLRGEPDTKVSVTIMRPASGQLKEITLTRKIIEVAMVKDINGKQGYPLGENKIGYVHLLQFGEKTADDLETALKTLKSEGMQALVLDLRGNPGGLLDQAVEVCEKFLPRGQLIVSTEGRNISQNSSRRAAGRGDELVSRDGSSMPIVVLVNLGSASASEIVAGCLQDLHRAIIVGEKSFGKGSVQSIIPLEDGSALRLTTAKYYTPSHKVIHEVGILPNVVVPVTDDEERDIMMQRMPGALESLDDKERERVKSAHDPQLDRATDLLKGILMFTERAPGRNGHDGKMAAMEPEGAAATR